MLDKMRELLRIVLVCSCAILLVVKDGRCEDSPSSEVVGGLDVISAPDAQDPRKDAKNVLPGNV